MAYINPRLRNPAEAAAAAPKAKAVNNGLWEILACVGAVATLALAAATLALIYFENELYVGFIGR
jgi:hypothetical protein